MKDTKSLDSISQSIPFKWLFLGFTSVLLFPSLSLFNKIGLVYGMLYIGLGTVGLLISFHKVIPFVLSRLSEKMALYCIITTFFILFLLFITIYPKIDKAGIVIGDMAFGAADTDNSLYNATSELFHGRYPYYRQNFRGYFPSQMPGALLLATPFYLLGHTSVQNFFWLIVFLIVAKHFFKETRLALILLWLSLFFSPVIIYHLIAGMNYMSNGMYVMTFMILMIYYVSKTGSNVWGKIIFSILFGISLSSRPNFSLLVPLVFSSLYQQTGYKNAIKYTSITCISAFVLTFIFYIYDPISFSPFGKDISKIINVDSVSPKISKAIFPMLSLCLSFLMASLKSNRDLLGLLRNSAIVEASIVVGGVIAVVINSDSINLSYSHYGLLFFFFGILGFGVPIFQRLYPEGKRIAKDVER